MAIEIENKGIIREWDSFDGGGDDDCSEISIRNNRFTCDDGDLSPIWLGEKEKEIHQLERKTTKFNRIGYIDPQNIVLEDITFQRKQNSHQKKKVFNFLLEAEKRDGIILVWEGKKPIDKRLKRKKKSRSFSRNKIRSVIITLCMRGSIPKMNREKWINQMKRFERILWSLFHHNYYHNDSILDSMRMGKNLLALLLL